MDMGTEKESEKKGGYPQIKENELAFTVMTFVFTERRHMA
jgi:hypothetical protein